MTATNPTTIGITGATGHIGGQVARLLAADLPADTRLRLLVRDASRAPDLPGADVVEVQYGDPAAVEALTGVDVLLMVSAAESDDRVGEHRAFVEHAVEAGVGHLVYTSFVGRQPRLRLPARPRPRRHRGDHPGHGRGRDVPARQLLRRGVPVLRRRRGSAARAGRAGLVAPVSRRDVAEVAAAVLRAPAEHAGATYDLTGPEALTLDQIAAVLTDVTGRPHRFHDETLEEARASRAHYGAPDWMVEAWISTYTAIRDGELEAVSDDVPRLLGRPATSFRDAVTPA